MSGNKKLPPATEETPARKALFGQLRKMGKKVKNSQVTSEVAESVLGTTLREGVGIRGPQEGWDTDYAKKVDRHNKAIAPEVLGADARQNKSGQYEPAVNLNPAATLHDQVNRKVEVLELDDHALPIVADPQGVAYSPSRGGADTTDDGTPYYGVTAPRAIIGTYDQVTGFFDQRRKGGYRLVLTENGARTLGIQISPFIQLPEDKQWRIYDPQTEIVSYVVKSVASIGLGAGIGETSAAIPSGSLPIADLADFFNTVREQIKGNSGRTDRFARWTENMQFLVELLPHVALGEESAKPYVRKSVETKSLATIKGRQYVSFNLNTIGGLVNDMLAALKERLA